MSHRLLGSGIALLTAIGTGCHSAPKNGPLPECNTTQAAQPPGGTIRVQLPPQQITLVQPEGESCPTVVPPVQIGPPGGEPESAPKAPPKPPGRPESAPRRPTRPPAESAPEEEGAEEGVLSALGAINTLGQVAGFARTTAMTRQLGTVDPGSAGLGIGFRWIHIPVPWFRLFSVEEQPSITVPLTEANLVAHGGGVGVGVRGGGGSGLTREEMAELIAQEIQRRNRSKAPPPAPAPPADDAERRQLEKKLAAAEEQMERMAQALKALSDKLGPEPGKAPPK